MALDVNYQSIFQNSQFQQFVDFAESAVAAGKQRAVARVDTSELGGSSTAPSSPGPATGSASGRGVSAA